LLKQALPMSRRQLQQGFTALELLIVLAIAGCVAAMAIPTSLNMVDEFSLSGDAHGVSNSLALARMGAAANYTRSRLFIDRLANTYRIERWNRAAAAWQAVTGTSPLGPKNAFSPGAITAAPPNSQAVFGQPTACLTNAGAAIANTSCIIFNSRGVPIDSTGVPTPAAVIYMRGPTAVYGIAVSSTSQLAMWRISPGGGTWAQK
jgi:prepilin-type N-terminal cleavage/methylation domain-containing protein